MTNELLKKAKSIEEKIQCLKNEISFIERARDSIALENRLDDWERVCFLSPEFKEKIKKQILEHLRNKLDELEKQFKEL